MQMRSLDFTFAFGVAGGPAPNTWGQLGGTFLDCRVQGVSGQPLHLPGLAGATVVGWRARKWSCQAAPIDLGDAAAVLPCGVIGTSSEPCKYLTSKPLLLNS